ncbi:MAG: PEGA domain-containing protein [bacterium]
MIRRRLRAFFLVSALAGLVAHPTVAAAAPEGDSPRPRKAERLKTAVFIQQATGVKVEVVDKLSSRIKRALRKNQRLKLVRPARILASFSGELPTDSIEESKKYLKRGYALLEQKEYRKAITAFNLAITAQMQALAYTKKSKLVMAQFGLSLAYYHSGLRAQTLRMLLRLLTWRGRLRINPETLPKGYLRVLREAREKFKRTARASFELVTRPTGARAYLNGRAVGRTPLTLEGVPVGTHYLTVRQRGYLSLSEAVRISPLRKKTTLEYALKRSPKFILLEQALIRSWPDFGAARTTPAMQEIKTLLLVDQVVLVKPSVPTADGARIDVCLYDLRTGNLLKRISATLPGPKFKAKKFAAALYSGVRYDGTLPDPGNEKAPDHGGRRPIYKRWWFWVSIGAAVVAAVTGIAVPVSQRKSSNIPSGNHPFTVRF